MQAQSITDELSLETGSREASPLRVVIAYGDLAAGKRAMRLLATLSQAMADDLEFQPILWSFELLAESEWRDMATRDALNADILLLTASGNPPLPTAVGRWIDTVLRERQGISGAVVALFGQEEDPAVGGSPWLEATQVAARQAGLSFFSPTPRRELNEAVDRTVTERCDGKIHGALANGCTISPSLWCEELGSGKDLS